MYQNEWLDAIIKLYPKLHLDERVVHHSNKEDKKKQKILSWLEKIEKIHNIVAKKKDKHLEKMYKEMYYKLYIIKEEDIPDSYYQNQQRLARERGYGNIEITKKMKQELALQVIEDQKESLDKWLEYFLYDEEAKNYAMWEKYWVFQGIQTLGKYNKETQKFSKRDKTTVYPFPPVEREAIFTTLNLMEQYLKDKTGPNEIRNALGSSNFKQLYEYSLEQILKKGTLKNNGTEGIWIKYEQGSDYHKLRDSLQGYYTGWCTAAGENFAKDQLENGDFYVYYSKDKNNEYKIPRIAIRMEGTQNIGEIRGIAKNQNLEPEMIPILNKKLENFSDRDKYFKKEHDMQFLTKIDNKVKNNLELSKEDLKFLYEIDNKIEGFGYEKDPRINEIKSKRNIKKDLSTIFDCKEEEIGIHQIDDSYQGYKVWYGKIVVYPYTYEKIKLPQVVMGSLILRDIKTVEGLELPKTIGGHLYLANLETAKGLHLPKTIGGYLDLRGLTTAEGLHLPETIGSDIDLRGLTTAEGIQLPETIGGTLYLNGLTTAEGLQLPRTIVGSLYLGSLTTAKGLKFPETIEGSLYLNGLTTAEGLQLPRTIGSDIDLSGLTTAEGLQLPETIEGSLGLEGLTTAKGLKFPKTIGGDLNLGSLPTAEGIQLPEIIGGGLYLSSLRTAEGLKLPETIGGGLYLSSLRTAEGLKLPETIGGGLYLSRLRTAEGLKLPETIEGTLDLRGLTTTEGLQLPRTIGFDLDLRGLTIAEGLKLPETIEGSLDLSGLTTAEGLKLPKTIGGLLDLCGLTTIEGLDLSEIEVEYIRLFDGQPYTKKEIENYIKNNQERRRLK